MKIIFIGFLFVILLSCNQKSQSSYDPNPVEQTFDSVTLIHQDILKDILKLDSLLKEVQRLDSILRKPNSNAITKHVDSLWNYWLSGYRIEKRKNSILYLLMKTADKNENNKQFIYSICQSR